MERRDSKDRSLDAARTNDDNSWLTTQQGVRVEHTDDSLKAGVRGPTLLEDFHAREKITHFDHERIPERVVHARGAGAYGYFKAYDTRLRDYTAAEFLTEPKLTTPVFVRFSTVAGSRGSADTVRDVRGFATKFYTKQGNYDLVANNMPVFFIQDGVKFPDFVHAVKPEPASEIPQAQSAHDTFWDFVWLHPESLHMVMWLMSDRALPRSYRMMQGFGVHTFRLVDFEGNGTFVKFHWRPILGSHSLEWAECQRIAGADPDYNRRDLWDAIEAGQFPEFELGVQLISELREHDFDFDLLDPTKIVPEEQVPVQPVGRMVLNRNPQNFFAETEQVAFHTANVVPGIDFTNDPLLQARNFSYLDTQLIRLGGPNFSQLPINRPVVEVHTNQRDGYGQHTIHTHPTSYTKNSLGNGCPMSMTQQEPPLDVYRHYTQRVEGEVIRRRSESFNDHYSQARLFWNSMKEVEQQHIRDAFCFELSKVSSKYVRQRVTEQIAHVDPGLAMGVARKVGVPEPEDFGAALHNDASSALSQVYPVAGFDDAPPSIESRRIAALVCDGVDDTGIRKLASALSAEGALLDLIGPAEGAIRGESGHSVDVSVGLSSTASVLYDAVIVPGGDIAALIETNGSAKHFLLEAFKHHKAVAAFGAGVEVLRRNGLTDAETSPVLVADEEGVIVTSHSGQELPDEFIRSFIDAVALHRIWNRETSHITA
ncbi:catalase [Hoyosella subflava]|uniref:Catalase n=1 Tax=Hoyosella subflava (strain DSM 45089 / JCM 17490 / NBRC 109087 / DQS3-9A1) TaxID=443218 RepID=F6EH35_HOYSD|nr:catalase [Hoyosella subflava]AEF39872.1 Catalase [Hoyosella subflava DQS3-9A1]